MVFHRRAVRVLMAFCCHLSRSSPYLMCNVHRLPQAIDLLVFLWSIQYCTERSTELCDRPISLSVAPRTKGCKRQPLNGAIFVTAMRGINLYMLYLWTLSVYQTIYSLEFFNEWCIVNDVEGNGRDLNWGTVQAFVCKDWKWTCGESQCACEIWSGQGWNALLLELTLSFYSCLLRLKRRNEKCLSCKGFLHHTNIILELV
jgi:hypothetical protein